MRKAKKSEVKLHFCILNSGAKEGERPTLYVDIEDLGITKEQALEIANEVSEKCETVASWITYPSTEEEVKKAKSKKKGKSE